MINISVIICCYNSASRLPETLRHLALQEVPPEFQWEVILVDNNSSDDTASVAVEIWKELGSPVELKVVEEKNPGLSNARKTGVFSAKGEIIIFCDDDNWLNKDYINRGFKTMKGNSSIGILAGRGEVVPEVELPYWFSSFQKNFAVGMLSYESSDITKSGWVWGAGMILRANVMRCLIESGFRNITSDRRGSNLSSGGDVEICYWHILLGYKLWFDETLVFKHWMPANRLNKEYLKQLLRSQNISNNILRIYRRHIVAIKGISSEQRLNVNRLYLKLIIKSMLMIYDLRLFYLFPFLVHFARIKDQNIIKPLIRAKNQQLK